MPSGNASSIERARRSSGSQKLVNRGESMGLGDQRHTLVQTPHESHHQRHHYCANDAPQVTIEMVDCHRADLRARRSALSSCVLMD